jgi:hypothetical protein
MSDLSKAIQFTICVKVPEFVPSKHYFSLKVSNFDVILSSVNPIQDVRYFIIYKDKDMNVTNYLLNSDTNTTAILVIQLA